VPLLELLSNNRKRKILNEISVNDENIILEDNIII
jgi:hypothetical protein